MQPAITIRDMTKTYQIGDIAVGALQGVSLEIEQGDFVAIMGPSGSGKSTLMNMIGCLDVPTSGSYLLDGEEVATLSGDALSLVRARKLGFVFQQYMLLPRQPALRQVEMPLIYRGVPAAERRRRAEVALGIVGMSKRMSHKPTELSGGQQQRVAIARALAMQPKAMLFDEVTSALDPELVGEVLDVMRQLVQEGMTMVIVTHEMAFARAFAHKVVFMADGEVVESGPAEAVFGSPRAPRLQNFLKRFQQGYRF